MRPFPGLPLRFQATLIVLFFIAVPFTTPAQNSNPLPAQWNVAMSQLADKIAAAVRPARSLTFNAVENVSSISPADVTLLRHLLEAELAARKIRVVQDPLPETLGDIKISEGVEGPLMTVEIHRSDDVDSREGIAIVALQKRAVTSSPEGGVPLILQRRFIFAQAEPILDFVSPDAPDGPGTRPLMRFRAGVGFVGVVREGC